MAENDNFQLFSSRRKGINESNVCSTRLQDSPRKTHHQIGAGEVDGRAGSEYGGHSDVWTKNKKSRKVDICSVDDSRGSDSTPSGEEARSFQEGLVSESEVGQEVDFHALGLSPWLCRVCKSLGMQRPTPVQTGCIPAILAGRDVIGTAHTGSGKTAAFALPILQLLAADPFGVFALILTPTRELAIQIGEQFRALASGMTFQDAVVIGGVDMGEQARQLARRPHVVVATPGRLRDLLQQQEGLGDVFRRARFLVLDEADRVLDPGFESELRVIGRSLPASRSTLLFSATMTPSLLALQQVSLQDAHTFQAYEGLETAHNLREQYLFLPDKVKDVYVLHLLQRLEERGVRSAIIFVSKRRTAHALSLLLDQMDVPAAVLHSGLPQGVRLANLDRFKSGRVSILLATDVASRGLDIPTVDLVLNYDLPVEARDYVHRVGRTARAGRPGWALTVVTQFDVLLLQTVERLIGHKLAEFTLDEKQVLTGLNKVFKAKRAALVRAQELDMRTQSAGRPNLLERGSKRKSTEV
eukprot:jgi/Botrbrau1/3099/Bobra.0070s0083.1